jgi:Fe-S cluster biosynthesis and repair protein YggX
MSSFRAVLRSWLKFSATVSTLVVTILDTITIIAMDQWVTLQVVQIFIKKMNIVNLGTRSWKLDCWYYDDRILMCDGYFHFATLDPY